MNILLSSRPPLNSSTNFLVAETASMTCSRVRVFRWNGLFLRHLYPFGAAASVTDASKLLIRSRSLRTECRQRRLFGPLDGVLVLDNERRASVLPSPSVSLWSLQPFGRRTLPAPPSTVALCSPKRSCLVTAMSLYASPLQKPTKETIPGPNRMRGMSCPKRCAPVSSTRPRADWRGAARDRRCCGAMRSRRPPARAGRRRRRGVPALWQPQYAHKLARLRQRLAEEPGRPLVLFMGTSAPSMVCGRPNCPPAAVATAAPPWSSTSATPGRPAPPGAAAATPAGRGHPSRPRLS